LSFKFPNGIFVPNSAGMHLRHQAVQFSFQPTPRAPC
jgi:hypothetical protein